ncbi:MAG: hypothetical protein AAGB12_10295 [Pseudomonadota bacterium]
MFLLQNTQRFKKPHYLILPILQILLLFFINPVLSKPQTDTDQDGVIDVEDNCSEVFNALQLNSDNDAFGNACDGDYDNNNIVDFVDLGLFNEKFVQKNDGADLDENGIVDLNDFTLFYGLLNQPPGPGAVPYIPFSEVSGNITDITGQAVFNSQLQVYQNEELIDVTVEQSGNTFSISLPASQDYTLSVITPDYANHTQTIRSPLEAQNNAISIHLIERGNVNTISNNGITTQDNITGAAVTFDKADFIQKDGSSVQGDMQLSITALDLARTDTTQAFPGSFSGLSATNERQEIVSLGAVEFHFTANGEKINLAPNKTAEVILPLFKKRYQDGRLVQVGDQLPLWSLNESTGQWLQEGLGEVVASDITESGLALKATTSHFSWWNYGYVPVTAPITVTVLGDKPGEATLFATAPALNWNNASITIGLAGTSDPLPVPVDTPICLNAFILYEAEPGLPPGFAVSETECFEARSGQTQQITLTSPSPGNLNLVSQPIGPDEDSLKLYTSVGEAIPLQVSPLTAESDVTYSIINGSLPPGVSLVLSGLKAELLGQPNQVGVYNFTIMGQDSDRTTDTIAVTYHVEELPTNAINLPYDETTMLTLGIGLHSGYAEIDWNDGSEIETIYHNRGQRQDYSSGFNFALVSHTFVSPIAGNITIRFSDGLESVKYLRFENVRFNINTSRLSDLTQLQQLSSFNSKLNGTFSELPDTLEYLSINNASGSKIAGSIQDLSKNLLELQLSSGVEITGNVKDLSRHLKLFTLDTSTYSSITGDVKDLPASMTVFFISGNTLYGDIQHLPDSLLQLSVGGSNNLSGDIANLSSTLTSISIEGYNTVTGDIASIPNNVTYVYMAGNNTLSGTTDDLPDTLNSFHFLGDKCYLTGNLADLPPNSTKVTLECNNTLQGDIKDLPNNPTDDSIQNELINFIVKGQNTISGNIKDFPATTGWIEIFGNNTILGNIAELHDDISIFEIEGQNTILGNIANLPEEIHTFRLKGMNTITGNIADLKSNLTYFEVDGQNALQGDVGALKTNNIIDFIVGGNNAISDFGLTPSWRPNRLYRLILTGNLGGYSTSSIDSLLDFLSNNTVRVAGGRIELQRPNDAPPSDAADDAIYQLKVNKGFTVRVNSDPDD